MNHATRHLATKALIDEWHGKGRQLYAVTPRFAITSSPEQMEMAGQLMREHPDLHMQTHLSENHAEIALTAELQRMRVEATDARTRASVATSSAEKESSKR